MPRKHGVFQNVSHLSVNVVGTIVDAWTPIALAAAGVQAKNGFTQEEQDWDGSWYVTCG
jgi:hypothetical protein